MRYFLILVGLLLFIPPSGTPLPPNENSQATRHNANSTVKSELPNDVMPLKEPKVPNSSPHNPPAEEKRNIEPHQGFDYILWGFGVNAILVLGTLVIAIFSVVQASAARRALILTHRPRLLAWPIEVEGFDGGRIGVRLTNGRVFITNTGVLPAKIQKFWADWYFWDRMPLDNPAHSVDQGGASGKCPPGHYVTFPLPEFKVPESAFIAINNSAEAAEVGFAGSSRSLTQPPPGKLYLVGCVKYRDEIGLRRQYFAYSWEPSQGRFEAVQHPGYNYEK